MDGVLQLVLVAMTSRSDSLPGGVNHSVTARCSEGWPLVPIDDLGLREDLYDCLEFHTLWTQDFLDPISRGGGDAQLY
jgi:hypothetical protein